MDFTLTNEQRAWQMTARKFAQEEIRRIVSESRMGRVSRWGRWVALGVAAMVMAVWFAWHRWSPTRREGAEPGTTPDPAGT